MSAPLNQKVKLVALNNYVFENQDLQILIAILTIFTCQKLDAKEKVDGFSLEKSSSFKMLKIGTLLKVMIHLIYEKK